MAGTKKYVKKTTKKYVKKAGAKKTSGMSAELMKLKRQVARLTKVAINKIQYQYNFNFGLTNAAGTPSYAAYNLFKFNNWTRVFGTDADDEVNKNCLIRNLTARTYISTSEPDARSYSTWVVQLKDNASQLLEAGTGNLLTLTSGTHYINSGSEVLLNLKYFKVIHHRARHMGVYPMSKAAGPSSSGAVQNIPTNGVDTIQLGSFRIAPARGIRVSNPSGDWKAGIYPQDPSQNYFYLCFWSGDSIADTEYASMYVDNLISVEVSG